METLNRLLDTINRIFRSWTHLYKVINPILYKVDITKPYKNSIVVFNACDQELLASGRFSDFQITCKGDVYHVHKAIVCNRSEFFAKAATFPVGREAQDGRVDLVEDERPIVGLLVTYLYKGDYGPTFVSAKDSIHRKAMDPKNREWHVEFPHTCRALPTASHNVNRMCHEPYVCPHHTCGLDCCDECWGFFCDKCVKLSVPPNDDAEQLITHAKMYMIGDKYMVAGLKDLARSKFETCCLLFWNSDAFVTATEVAFKTTLPQDRGLRDIIHCVLSHHYYELMKKPGSREILVRNGESRSAMRRENVERRGQLATEGTS